jgi:CheY-like chemotaxis protein
MAPPSLALDESPDDASATDDEEKRTTDKVRARDHRPRRVALVVDDSADMHALCRAALEDEGFWVQTALDGQDALELLLAMPTPSVIILDLLMPRMGGLELLEVIRSYRRLANVPVLVVTASDEPLPEGEKVEVLRKPIQCGELASSVRTLLGEGGSTH